MTIKWTFLVARICQEAVLPNQHFFQLIQSNQLKYTNAFKALITHFKHSKTGESRQIQHLPIFLITTLRRNDDFTHTVAHVFPLRSLLNNTQILHTLLLGCRFCSSNGVILILRFSCQIGQNRGMTHSSNAIHTFFHKRMLLITRYGIHAHSSTDSRPIARSHPSPGTCLQSPQTLQTTWRRTEKEAHSSTPSPSLLFQLCSHTDSSLPPTQPRKCPTPTHHSSTPFSPYTLQEQNTIMPRIPHHGTDRTYLNCVSDQNLPVL